MTASMWDKIIPGFFGLVGVLVGAAIPWLRERLADRTRRAYTAIRTVTVLDKFVEDCAGAVAQYNNDLALPVSERPQTLDLPPDIEWRLLDNKLLYRILALPNRVVAAANAVNFISQVASTEHDPQHLAAVDIHYAPLGIEAAALATELRMKFGLPHPTPSGDWRPLDILKDVQQKSLGISLEIMKDK